MESPTHRALWKTLLAFAIIYLVWGSTYLAIRVGVREVPPFLLAAIRFLIAGLVLYGWMMARGERPPSGRQWASASLLAIMFFVLDYGLLFWAERRVPSGIAAVMMAMIPVFMALAEIILLRTQKLTFRLTLALLIGVGGVAILMSRSLILGGAPIDRVGALALLVASVSWAVASVLARLLPLPPSKIMSAGSQMLAGGVFLALTAAALGEFHNFHPWTVSREAWLALLYLIVAGSIIAFTAYLWLIHHESPTKVGTYAYVNPVVAVLVGYFLGGEALGLRTILGTLLVLISVLVITTAPTKKPATNLAEDNSGEQTPQPRATVGQWAKHAGLFMLFGTLLMIPRIRRLRRRVGAWACVRLGAAACGTWLGWRYKHAGAGVPSLVGGVLLFAFSLLVRAKPVVKSTDAIAGELDALIVLNGGLFLESPDSTPIPHTQIFLGPDQIVVLGPGERHLLKIPLAKVRRLEARPVTSQAGGGAEPWEVEVHWLAEGPCTTTFQYEGAFAEHLAQVTESTLRSQWIKDLPVIHH
jgi:drug/metabolite transporter (DMT)-like permease